jgi:tRNA dimethylallyltransferase
MILGAIVGATASGKTSLAVSLAKLLDCEIISVDSRQIYKNMEIGTAQPTVSELCEVKHHLINFVSPTVQYNVGHFLEFIRAKHIEKRRYLLVGGTGFYIKAIVDGVSSIPDISEDVKLKVNKYWVELGEDGFREKLDELDASASKRIFKNNGYKLKRALEVCLETGKSYSSFNDKKTPIIPNLKILGLDWPREALYQRINERTPLMVAGGWMEEAEELMKLYPEGCLGLNTLGYPEIVKVLKGEIVLQNAVDLIAQSTRRLAKRQLTFFRNQFAVYWVSAVKTDLLLKDAFCYFSNENFIRKN